VNASDLFAADEIERARRYHRPLYLALAADWALQLAILLLIAFGPPGDWLWSLTGGPWWARTLELVALVIATTTFVRLPLSAWRGWAHERRWGFSTQTLRGWLWDVAKGLVLGAALTGLALVLLVWAAGTWPGWWAAVAAPGAALLTLVLSLLAPLLFERVFNRFWALPDESLARDLRELSERAEVPVRTILVSDASRRTRKHNAYVSGIGPTRRLVLFDTLLADADAAGDPRVVPLVLLAFWVMEIVALPWETWLSRRWERQADRFALELTGDGEALEQMHRRLARANLADLDPPPLLYALLFSHPTPPERIAAARMQA
jgi:STE24 endopeptidase